ncbi:MAG TPA: SRPBCC domain-containing protein [Caulobacteraceae bacterium]
MKADDSVLSVRRSIHIHAPAARVWEAFTSIDSMGRWWGAVIGVPTAGTPSGQWLMEYQPAVGGRCEMEVLIDGQRTRYGGKILVFDPARELSFDSDWMPNQGWEQPTTITIRLRPALGGTLVELFHHGFEHTGGDVSSEHAGYEQGWGMTQLLALKTMIET